MPDLTAGFMPEWAIFLPALAAGLLVLLTHVPLGRVVLQRGIIFIDLAIAQIAGLGVILAYSLGWEIHGFKTQLVALATALLGAWLLAKAEGVLKERQEALIGISFVLAATAGLLLLAHNPHGGEYLRELLIGQILWTTWEQLVLLTIVTLLLAALFLLRPHRLNGTVFYLVFAVVITFSVQIVGVYLVFSSLIIPAFAVYHVKRYPLQIAFALGVLGYVLGLLVSVYFDLPTGAAIVWLLAVTAVIFLFMSLLIALRTKKASRRMPF